MAFLSTRGVIGALSTALLCKAAISPALSYKGILRQAGRKQNPHSLLINLPTHDRD